MNKRQFNQGLKKLRKIILKLKLRKLLAIHFQKKRILIYLIPIRNCLNSRPFLVLYQKIQSRKYYQKKLR